MFLTPASLRPCFPQRKGCCSADGVQSLRRSRETGVPRFWGRYGATLRGSYFEPERSADFACLAAGAPFPMNVNLTPTTSRLGIRSLCYCGRFWIIGARERDSCFRARRSGSASGRER
eukprot:scaffold5067_cov245-Pinguiococcus_pyrenoidosus.AAC.16